MGDTRQNAAKGEAMPRITLLTDKSQVPAEQHAEFDTITEVLGQVGGPFGVLAYSPGLAEKVMAAGAQVRLKSSLTPAERQIAVLATLREKDAVYEWGGHYLTGQNLGLSPELLDAIRSRGDVSGFSPDERDIVTFVRQLIRTNRVDQTVFDSMRSRHDARWVVEIAATCGQYQYISSVTNPFELDARADRDQLPVP
jgi:4-carboxymuconolactone decarboxylase